ncbi:hypothetical protein F511_28947 [Dorcoceras hygrometricum]|uniref:Uncharacterized protein n=1 Tax=Dorcoceras hygrometricum TaxID=472368 RepID=A0A2Z7B2T4_9LAMI|nr:hypothetical protein F511_28947 [Dorcoceras hygrometricum]
MSSPSTTPVSSTAASIDSVPVSPETKEPWLPDQAKLGSSQPPWYEEKSSNLRSSDISFIKEKGGMSNRFEGNPSFHKGWMSRFFFVRRVDRKRDPWKCDMSWRDNIYTFTPRTPERSPNLTSFLDAMREKCYNAPELIQEDLLCAFGFSRRGVELVGDLGIAVSCLSRVLVYMYHSSPALIFTLFSFCADERMGKAELVKAMQEEARASGEVEPPKKVARKRPAVSSAEEEARLEKRKKKGASTSGTRPGESPKMTRVPTPPTRASEETSDLPPIITIPEASSPVRGKGPERVLPFDFSKDSLVDSPTGVVSTRLICNMVSDQDLSVLKGAEDAEAVGHFAANLTSRKELEAELAAEKEARATEKRALRAELERANARAKRVKEDFLKSPEFDSVLAKKAWGYFKDGFWGCLAQFRSNGYSEEEHPASFLNLQQALENLGDDEDAEDEEEEQEEGEVGDGTEDNIPNSPKP